MSIKKAYTNDEVMEIMETHFPKGFIISGVFDEVTDDGISEDYTFSGKKGNINVCFGLSYQLTKSIQRQIDKYAEEWEDED